MQFNIHIYTLMHIICINAYTHLIHTYTHTYIAFIHIFGTTLSLNLLKVNHPLKNWQPGNLLSRRGPKKNKAIWRKNAKTNSKSKVKNTQKFALKFWLPSFLSIFSSYDDVHIYVCIIRPSAWPRERWGSGGSNQSRQIQTYQGKTRYICTYM